MSTPHVRLGLDSDLSNLKYPHRFNKRENRLIETALYNKNIDVAMRSQPIVSRTDSAGADYEGTDAQTVGILIDGEHFELHTIGTQTIQAPVHTSVGLDIGMDQTNDDGCELTNGIDAKSKAAFVVGTDEDFFFEATVKIEDVSGTDDCAFGFRKAEAYQAAIDDYDEMACLNIISGDIKSETILNNGATVTSAALATLADGDTVTLRTVVRKSGAVEFYVNGSKVGSPFSFDAGEVVVPFCYFLHASDVAGKVEISQWTVGKL